MHKKILLPLDGSKLAKKALEPTEELANIYGAEIILFQVVPLMAIYIRPQELVPVVTIDKKQREAAEMGLRTLAEEMRTRGHR